MASGQSTKNRRAMHGPAQTSLVNGSLSYLRLTDGCIAVKDLDFAAYCKLRGLVGGDAICTMGQGSAPRRYLFRFYDPDDHVRQLGIDFSNSEAAAHADVVRRLKRICRVVPDSDFSSSELEGNSCIINKSR